MAIPNRQIGWSNESNLLWFISKELERLTGVTSSSLASIIAALSTKITNEQGVPAFYSDTLANIPPAGETGRMFIATDTFAFYRDNGVGWDLIGGPGIGTVTGSGAATQVAFWNGASVVSGSSNLYWDNVNNRLGIGGTPGAFRLDVNGTARVQGATTITGSTTASGAIARGINATPTLVASANNDVLVGLDVNPTFTNGAFTGVMNYGIRSFLNLSGIYDGLQIRNTAGGANAQSRIKFDNDITPTQTSTGAVIFYTSSVFSGFPSNTLGFYNYNSTGALAFGTNAGERMRMFSTGNVLIQNGGTFTDAGFRLDVNGTARVQGNTTITGAVSATANGHRFGNLEVLTTGTAGTTGQGILITGVDQTFIFLGSGNPESMFLFRNYTSLSATANLNNTSKSVVRFYGGFTDGNINNLSGNQLWLSPTYNFAGTRTGIVVRGIYYNPTLTSLTNTTHRAIETETGDVLLGTTSGNVAIGTSTTPTAKLQVTGSITAASAIARGVLIDNTLVAAANNDVLTALDINPTFTNGAFTGVTNTALRVQGLTNIRVLATNFNSVLTVENTGTAAQANKNVATFIGARGNASNIDDNTNIGLLQKDATANNFGVFNFYNSLGNLAAFLGAQYTSHISATGNLILGTVNGSVAATKITVFPTGNTVIQNGGTFTDAGFRLDVNGTLRASGAIRTDAGNTVLALNLQGTSGSIQATPSNGTSKIDLNSQSITATLSCTANNYYDFRSSTGAASLRLGTTNLNGGGIEYYASVNGAFGNHRWYFNAVEYMRLEADRLIIDGTGTLTTNNTAQLQVNSTTKGFLPPRMTTAQKNGIVGPANGLVVYDTTLAKLCVFTGVNWETVTSV